MSTPDIFLPSRPANDGGLTASARWERAPKALEDRLARTLGVHAPCLTWGPWDAPGPPIKAMTDDGPVLLKVVDGSARDRAAQMLLAARLSAALPASAPVPRPMQGYPVETPALGTVFADRFIEGRHPSPTPDDLAAVGRAIASLHDGFRHLPDDTAIRASSLSIARDRRWRNAVRAGPRNPAADCPVRPGRDGAMHRRR